MLSERAEHRRKNSEGKVKLPGLFHKSTWRKEVCEKRRSFYDPSYATQNHVRTTSTTRISATMGKEE